MSQISLASLLQRLMKGVRCNCFSHERLQTIFTYMYLFMCLSICLFVRLSAYQSIYYFCWCSCSFACLFGWLDVFYFLFCFCLFYLRPKSPLDLSLRLNGHQLVFVLTPSMHSFRTPSGKVDSHPLLQLTIPCFTLIIMLPVWHGHNIRWCVLSASPGNTLLNSSSSSSYQSGMAVTSTDVCCPYNLFYQSGTAVISSDVCCQPHLAIPCLTPRHHPASLARP